MGRAAHAVESKAVVLLRQAPFFFSFSLGGDKQCHIAAAALRPWEWAWAGVGKLAPKASTACFIVVVAFDYDKICA
jgi:hypothetical protein